ncbi:MAG: hypothetical protein K6357_00510 [Elusimicrobiota bacterium]
MEISKKIARLIYPHFRFGESKVEDAIKLVKLGVGGFCLYGGSLDEVIDFIRTVRSNALNPVIFAADYENGVGQWVSGATKLPSNMAICASGNIDFAVRKGQITAIESDALGVDWVFAPVLDIANNHANPIVNLRAFSDEIEKIISFSKAFISGLNSFNILNSIKHFPGHGDTSVDSHLVLPEIRKSEEEIENMELLPFKAVLDFADSVMVGHLKILSMDNKNPASLSKNIITDLLREKMQYKKIVVTDALMMKAISNEIESGLNAFLAGADILLYPEDPYRLYAALMDNYNRGVITEDMVNKAIRRQDALIAKRRAMNYKTKDISVIGCNEHKKFVYDCAIHCISWVKKNKEPLPKKIYYYETLSTKEIKGEVFVKELMKNGFEIKSEVNNSDAIVVGIFSKPKAFSGSINMNEEEKKEIDKLILTGKKVIFISFGSPFIFDGYLKKIEAGICCFSDLEEFQKVAADAICGISEVYGKMPVKIYD